MAPAVAKLSEEVVILICLLFAPAGEKQVLLDMVDEKGVQGQVVALRTETGFAVAEKDSRGRTKPMFTVSAVKAQPCTFEVKDRRGRQSQVDLTAAAEAASLLKQAPTQEFKVQGAGVRVLASGKIVFLNAEGLRATCVVHAAGEPPRPEPAPTTQPAEAGVEQARKLWAAVAKGDTQAMEPMYAEKVLIKAGSELLWKEHGISESGDRSKDAVGGREKVVRAHEHLIQGVGKARWVQIFSGQEEPIRLTITVATKDGETFKEVRKGDVILKPAPDSDEMIWVLRKDQQGRWRVVIEKFDI